MPGVGGLATDQHSLGANQGLASHRRPFLPPFPSLHGEGGQFGIGMQQSEDASVAERTAGHWRLSLVAIDLDATQQQLLRRGKTYDASANDRHAHHFTVVMCLVAMMGRWIPMSCSCVPELVLLPISPK